MANTVASIVELNQWIVDRLNDLAWGMEFEAYRRNYDYIDATSATFPQVIVFPNIISTEINPRGSTTDDPIITIRICVKAKPFDTPAQDAAILLAEEIRDWFRTQEQDPPDASLLPSNTDLYEIQIPEVMEVDVMTDYNLFSQRMNLRYKIRRETKR